MWLESVVVILFSLNAVNSFNLDAVNYARFTGMPSSMFGFTVATHRERGTGWVLVGAPNAQNQQPGVDRGGAVYRCRSDADDSCQEVPFDRKGHNVDNQGRNIDSKSNQWFGATLQSSGEDGPIVACAPRYVYFAHKLDRRDPVGTCYVAKGDFSSYSEYSPCRTAYFGYHRQGSCQAGFSAAISKNGRRLFVGGPGSWYWQGQMYSIDAQATFPFTPGIFGGAFGSGQVIQQSLETRPSVISTRSGNERDDNSYMGYSAAVGDFTGDGEQGVAVGMPRGANLYGKIVLYTWNLTNHQNISGQQLGAYFGYAVAAGDIDGDHTDDLIIGAPMHTEPNNEGKYEVGRVIILYQGTDPTKRFRRLNILDGFNSKSRFGLSLASLGDINLDGFGDFAVGAPYDGPHERGAVYIYRGSTQVIGSKYTQVIYAEDVSAPGPPLNTFGFSVAGGLDLDQNDYPDMAVGSYLSNAAFFFRSRPVIKLDSYVRFLTANKQIILDEKNCTLRNRQPVSCTSIDFCMKFTGVGVPHNVELEVQYVLDTKKPKRPRMFFLSNENLHKMNETLHLQKDGRHVCKQKIVYIKNDIRDKLTPLEVEVRYSMRETHSFQQHSQSRNPRSVLVPILDLNSDQFTKDVISVHKNCGPDNICIPNLNIIAKSNVERYLLGSNEKLVFDIIVQNKGEDSFESTFDLQMPPGVNYNKLVVSDKMEFGITCSLGRNNTIRCDIGNPLPAYKTVQFQMLMTPYHKEGMSPSYDFLMAVNSSNPEVNETLDGNHKMLRIPIWVDSKLELGGISRPNEIHYNASLYTEEKIQKESDIGPQVIHLYSIKNNGPSGINEAEMLFLWPYETLGGEDLLYLLEQPHTYGNVKCDAADANRKGYELEFRKKTIWESLGIEVSKGDISNAMGQSSGIFIEEGEGTYGSLGGEKVNTKIEHEYDQGGDASQTHAQRGKLKPGQTDDSQGTRVLVTEDQGSGSTVHEEAHTSGFTSSYMRNTSYIGPDGKVHYKVTYGQDGDGSGGPDTSYMRNTSYIGPDGRVHHKVVYGDGSSQGGGSFESGITRTYTTNTSYIGPDGKVHYRITYGKDGAEGAGGMTSTSTSVTTTYMRNTTYIGPDGKIHYKVTYGRGTPDGVVYPGGSDEASSTGFTRTYMTNTSYVGPDGKVHYKVTYSRDGSDGGGIIGQSSSGSTTHTSSGSTHTSGASGATSGSAGWSFGDTHHTTVDSNKVVRPNIVYTSSGNHGQTGTTFTSTSSGGSSSTGQTDQNINYGASEGRQSGQTFTHAEGGQTVYQEGHYPGGKPKTNVNTHFNWDGSTGSRNEEEYSGRGSTGRHYENRTHHGSSGYGAQTGATHHEESYNTGTDAKNVYPENYDLPYSSEEYYGSVENNAYDEEPPSPVGGGVGQHSSVLSGNRRYNHTQSGGSWSQGGHEETNYDDEYAQHGLGAAAQGHGFRTTSVDLGALGGDARTHSSGHQEQGRSHGATNYGTQHQSGRTWGSTGTTSHNSRGRDNSAYDNRHDEQGLGSAAQGHGFRTTSLDLGTLDQGSSGGHHEQSTGGSMHGYDASGHQRGSADSRGNRWESRTETRWSSSGSGAPPQGFEAKATMIERDNVATDKPDYSNRFVGRRRRQISDPNDVDIRSIMHCKSTKCLMIRCTVGPLAKDQDAIVALRSRVNIRTLKNITTSTPISFSSMMVARISKLPYIGTPLDRQVHSHEVFTTVPASEPDIKPYVIPLWVVILSAVAGTIILLLLIYLLYKCGFFKRNRPSDAPERQPLNRNGYYGNADAAL